jgi:hypothetical protein
MKRAYRYRLLLLMILVSPAFDATANEDDLAVWTRNVQASAFRTTNNVNSEVGGMPLGR